nr:MAG TPA: hypothetical protein [Bacteriophage sp.]
MDQKDQQELLLHGSLVVLLPEPLPLLKHLPFLVLRLGTCTSTLEQVMSTRQPLLTSGFIFAISRDHKERQEIMELPRP